MLSISRWNAVALAAAVAAVLTIACPAEAQVKPFKISGEGIGEEGLPLPGQEARPHWIIGEATHLGRHYGEGSVRTDSAEVDLAAGVITGDFGSGDDGFNFVAANGDLLATYYGRTDKGASEPGTFELTVLGATPDGSLIVEALWIAQFVVQPELSTGRFAGVTGSWIMVAGSEPFVLGSDHPVYYAWEGEGELTFPKGKR